MKTADHHSFGPQISLRVDFGAHRFGPGKAALLRAIDTTASLSAAAKATGISYRKAWRLVEEANQLFGRDLVEKAPGGASGGGAALTAFGRQVLEAYGAVVEAASCKAEEVFADVTRR